MFVCIENKQINTTAILGITADIVSNSIRIQQVNSLDNAVDVEFSVVPIIELINGKTITMHSQASHEKLVINEYKLMGSSNKTLLMQSVLAVLETELLPFKLKVAESAANFISQPKQVILHEELEGS